MSNKYQINSEIVQITEQNYGTIIGKKIESNPELNQFLQDIIKRLETLKNNYPNTTESQAKDIIEAEIVTLQTQNPHQWQMLRQEFFNKERWLNGGRQAFITLVDHYINDNIFYKEFLAFMDGFTQSSP